MHTFINKLNFSVLMGKSEKGVLKWHLVSSPQCSFSSVKTHWKKTLYTHNHECRQPNISTECVGKQLLIRGQVMLDRGNRTPEMLLVD